MQGLSFPKGFRPRRAQGLLSLNMSPALTVTGTCLVRRGVLLTLLLGHYPYIVLAVPHPGLQLLLMEHRLIHLDFASL